MIIEELLKVIPPEAYLSDVSVPWTLNLITAINTAAAAEENAHLGIKRLTTNSTGGELRIALRTLPVRLQVTILNDVVISFGQRRRRSEDRVETPQEEMELMDKRLKHSLIKYGALVFGSLAVIVVIAIIAISWQQKTAPDSQIATGLFTTFVEIIKLIFSAS